MTTDRASWMRAAHCVKLDGRALSPLHHQTPAVTANLCRSCPVRATCLGWALVAGIDDGILGGVDPVRRRQLRSRLLQRLAGRPIAGSPELAELVRAHSGPPARADDGRAALRTNRAPAEIAS